MAGGFLAKLLLTFLVILIVWRGIRIWNEVQAKLRQAEAERARNRRTPATRSLDLVKCPSCGTYIPRGGRCVNEGCARAASAGRS